MVATLEVFSPYGSVAFPLNSVILMSCRGPRIPILMSAMLSSRMKPSQMYISLSEFITILEYG